MKSYATSSLIVLAIAGTVFAQPPADGDRAPEPLDWKSLEAPFLSNHLQLTSRNMFTRSGEAYFSPDSNWIIFQATPIPPEGQPVSEFYGMYVARIERDDAGTISGLGEPILISPPDSANTCGWFHPHQPGRVLFGSTLVSPDTDQRTGFQVGTRRYIWLFPQETDIVTRSVPEILKHANVDDDESAFRDDLAQPVPLVTGPDYHAEGSWSPCGRFVLYAAVRPERESPRPDVDIWIYDTKTKQRNLIVIADGYDGGPFFSPDGKRLCYRSDRKRNDRLQIFVADLKFEDGVPVGIDREYQLTDNNHVNWAPFWHPSGDFLVYASSEIGHWNYEIFAIQADAKTLRAGTPRENLWHQRITFADGADVLPVFSPDGKLFMWTAQRGPLVPGENRPSSQLWVAEFNQDRLRAAATAASNQSGELTEERALALARRYLDEKRTGITDFKLTAQRIRNGWSVRFEDIPGRPGGHGVVEVRDDGSIEHTFRGR